jgi:hypothetical protein
MDRRSFLAGMLGFPTFGVALSGSGAVAGPSAPAVCADAPAESVALISEDAPAEFAQYRNSPHWHHRDSRNRHHRRHVRRRRVCRVHIDRWGRRVRRCHWVWI